MIDLYSKIVANQALGIDMVLVTAIQKEGEGPVEVGKKLLVVETGEFFGTVGGGALEHYAIEKAKKLLKTRSHLTEKYLLDKGKVTPEAKTLPMVCGGIVTLFYEFLGVKNFVYIFGAGHVGQALVHVLKPLNFHLTVIDERKEIVDAFKGGDVVHHQHFAEFIEEKKIKDKYKNISAYSFTTYNNELVVSFDGFEDQKDIIEFADFVFARIKMRYWHTDKVPTFH